MRRLALLLLVAAAVRAEDPPPADAAPASQSEEVTSPAPPAKVKLLCATSDGETFLRAIDLTGDFAELKERLGVDTGRLAGLQYELPDSPGTLISVKADLDVRNMFEELQAWRTQHGEGAKFSIRILYADGSDSSAKTSKDGSSLAEEGEEDALTSPTTGGGAPPAHWVSTCGRWEERGTDSNQRCWGRWNRSGRRTCRR